MRKLFLTFFYTGLSPYAPGTIGSIAAAIAGYFFLQYLPISTLTLFSILITAIAVKEIDIYEKEHNSHDPKEIVIDEVVGVWLAFALSSATIFQMLLSLVFFRIYDIWKPSIIGKVDKEYKGGLGVMGDDIIAGVLAGVSSALVYQVYTYLKLQDYITF
ncbi:MAG: phosphatidylglycerophosphatase A [Epsilonproteobacteria bacterium]|nr:phosphatidylglycerophosphatase A [Campylobacterota bacterium]